MLRSVLLAWSAITAQLVHAGNELPKLYPLEVAALMDPSVSPCDDFYKYACGGWLKNFTLPGDVAGFSYSFSTVDDTNRDVLLEIFNQDKPIVGELFASCMDLDKLNEFGTKPVAETRAKIAAVKSTMELFRLAGEISVVGPSFLTAFTVGPNPKNATLNILQISQQQLILGDPSAYTDPDSWAEYEEPYRMYITKIFSLNNVDNETALSNAKTVIQLEQELAQVFVPAQQAYDPMASYNPMKFQDAVKKYPLLFGALVDGAQVASLKPDDTIVVTTPSYFDEVEAYVTTNVTMNSLQTLLEFYYLDASSRFMGESFLSARFDFYGRVLNGQKKPTPREKICADVMKASFPDLVGKYFFEAKFSQESEQLAQGMIDLIAQAMQKRIQVLKWLDDATRKAALKKLSQVANLIGHSQSIEDFNASALNASMYFANMKTISQWKSNQSLAKIGHPVNRTKWDMSGAEVNAYYDPTTNQMVFPAGILQPPFFNKSFLPEQNFGSIGVVMGHELTHGFDDSGRLYDGDGNLLPWWTNETDVEFQTRAQCLEDQYSKFKVLSSNNSSVVIGTVNGNLTLGENIADNGGFGLAFDAFHDSLASQDNGKDSSSMDDKERLFFVAYAQTWCSQSTDAAAKQLLMNDVHSPDQFRLIGVIQNNARFGDLFQCKAGTPMNPTTKCQVW